MRHCDVCGEEAVVKAYGGLVRQQAELWGHDKPYAENHTFRCKKHEYRPPDPFFGELWLWKCKEKCPADFE